MGLGVVVKHYSSFSFSPIRENKEDYYETVLINFYTKKEDLK